MVKFTITKNNLGSQLPVLRDLTRTCHLTRMQNTITWHVTDLYNRCVWHC